MDDPLNKAVRMLVRLVAVGMILVAILLEPLLLIAHFMKHTELSIPKTVCYSGILLVGVVILVFSGRINVQINGESDNDDVAGDE